MSRYGVFTRFPRVDRQKKLRCRSEAVDDNLEEVVGGKSDQSCFKLADSSGVDPCALPDVGLRDASCFAVIAHHLGCCLHAVPPFARFLRSQYFFLKF